jgi:four helix bundle protein
VAEAWRKRRYPAAFVAKLGEAEAEAAETQTWIEFAERLRYLDADTARGISAEYDHVIARLVVMLRSPESWKVFDKVAPSLPHSLSRSQAAQAGCQ